MSTGDVFAQLADLATVGNVAIAGGLFVGSLLFSLALSALILVRLPVDYFVVDHRPLPLAGHAFPLRIGARVGLSLLGVALIAAGILMSLPGVPGQGLLTILLGVMLAEIPGKRRLERALVRRPLIHGAINHLRARFQKPPIVVPAAS